MTSYSDQLKAKRWASNLYGNDGALRDNYRYAVSRELPLEQDLVAVIVRGSAIEKEAPYLDELVASLGQQAQEQGLKVVVYAWKGFWDNWRTTSPNLTFKAHNDFDKPDVLARAGAICVLGYLPNYVIRRPEQRIVQVWAEPKDLCPAHSTVSRGYTSQLLGTSHLVAPSEEALNRALDEYRMRNLYAGTCLVGSEDGGFAQQMATLVTTGDAEELTELPLNQSKKRVLIYGRLIDDEAYQRLMLRLAFSFDYERYDVTLALSRQPEADQRAFLDHLPQELRIICRTGRFSLTPETYVEAQMDMEAIQNGAPFSTWDPHFGERVAKGELQRLLGSASFDTFVYCGESSALWYRLAQALPCPRKVKMVPSRLFTALTIETSEFTLPFAADCEACQEIFDALYADDVRVLEAAPLDAEKLELGQYDLAYDVEGALHTYTYHERASIDGLPAAFLGRSLGGIRLRGSLIPLPQEGIDTYLVDAAVGNAEELVNAVSAHATGAWECIVLGVCPDALQQRVITAYPKRVRFAGAPKHLSILSETAEPYVRRFAAYVADACLPPNDLRTAADNEDVPALVLAEGQLNTATDSHRMSKDEAVAFMRYQTEVIVG